jgi:hypothetical protein
VSEIELTPEEQAALAALPRERDPSRLLEERTVAALRERGLLRRPAAGRAARIVRAAVGAAAVIVFLIGFAAGRATAPDTPAGTRVSDAEDATVPAERPIRADNEPSRIVWL